MNKIRATQQLNKRELDACTPPNASWHTDFRHTAFVYIGGLKPELSEGDVVTIFSQYGEPVYVKLIRDKQTGKSKGFAFLKYEDQRSCDLAVDNLGGADVLGRLLRVDHAEYKPQDDEEIFDNTDGAESAAAAARIQDDHDRQERKSRRPQLKEERELMKLEAEHDAEDPMKEFMLDEKRKEVKKAVKRWERDNPEPKHKDRHSSHRSRRDSDDRDGRQRHVRDRSESPREDEAQRRHRRRDRSASPEHRHDRHGRDRKRERSVTPKREESKATGDDKQGRGRRKERSPTPKRGDPKARGETPLGRSWRDKIPTKAESESDGDEDQEATRKEAEEQRKRDLAHDRKFARYKGSKT